MQNEEIRKFNFSDFDIIISDCKEFLEFAYKNKLSKSAKNIFNITRIKLKKKYIHS